MSKDATINSFVDGNKAAMNPSGRETINTECLAATSSPQRHVA